jgi:pyridoxine 5'-phosphate synthase PdxJ
VQEYVVVVRVVHTAQDLPGVAVVVVVALEAVADQVTIHLDPHMLHLRVMAVEVEVVLFVLFGRVLQEHSQQRV